MASLGSIQQELVTMQSNTAVNKAKEQAANGPSQELDGDAFLMLMMEQLKNQDPMDPMDNPAGTILSASGTAGIERHN